MCGQGEGTRRATNTKTPMCWESVRNASQKEAADKADDIFFIQFNVTENIYYSKCCPDAALYAID